MASNDPNDGCDESNTVRNNNEQDKIFAESSSLCPGYMRPRQESNGNASTTWSSGFEDALNGSSETTRNPEHICTKPVNSSNNSRKKKLYCCKWLERFHELTRKLVLISRRCQALTENNKITRNQWRSLKSLNKCLNDLQEKLFDMQVKNYFQMFQVFQQRNQTLLTIPKKLSMEQQKTLFYSLNIAPSTQTSYSSNSDTLASQRAQSHLNISPRGAESIIPSTASERGLQTTQPAPTLGELFIDTQLAENFFRNVPRYSQDQAATTNPQSPPNPQRLNAQNTHSNTQTLVHGQPQSTQPPRLPMGAQPQNPKVSQQYQQTAIPYQYRPVPFEQVRPQYNQRYNNQYCYPVPLNLSSTFRYSRASDISFYNRNQPSFVRPPQVIPRNAVIYRPIPLIRLQPQFVMGSYNYGVETVPQVHNQEPQQYSQYHTCCQCPEIRCPAPTQCNASIEPCRYYYQSRPNCGGPRSQLMNECNNYYYNGSNCASMPIQPHMGNQQTRFYYQSRPTQMMASSLSLHQDAHNKSIRNSNESSHNQQPSNSRTEPKIKKPLNTPIVDRSMTELGGEKSSRTELRKKKTLKPKDYPYTESTTSQTTSYPPLQTREQSGFEITHTETAQAQGNRSSGTLSSRAVLTKSQPDDLKVQCKTINSPNKLQLHEIHRPVDVSQSQSTTNNRVYQESSQPPNKLIQHAPSLPSIQNSLGNSKMQYLADQSHSKALLNNNTSQESQNQNRLYFNQIPPSTLPNELMPTTLSDSSTQTEALNLSTTPTPSNQTKRRPRKNILMEHFESQNEGTPNVCEYSGSDNSKAQNEPTIDNRVMKNYGGELQNSSTNFYIHDTAPDFESELQDTQTEYGSQNSFPKSYTQNLSNQCYFESPPAPYQEINPRTPTNYRNQSALGLLADSYFPTSSTLSLPDPLSTPTQYDHDIQPSQSIPEITPSVSDQATPKDPQTTQTLFGPIGRQQLRALPTEFVAQNSPAQASDAQVFFASILNSFNQISSEHKKSLPSNVRNQQSGLNQQNDRMQVGKDFQNLGTKSGHNREHNPSQSPPSFVHSNPLGPIDPKIILSQNVRPNASTKVTRFQMNPEDILAQNLGLENKNESKNLPFQLTPQSSLNQYDPQSIASRIPIEKVQTTPSLMSCYCNSQSAPSENIYLVSSPVVSPVFDCDRIFTDTTEIESPLLQFSLQNLTDILPPSESELIQADEQNLHSEMRLQESTSMSPTTSQVRSPASQLHSPTTLSIIQEAKSLSQLSIHDKPRY